MTGRNRPGRNRPARRLACAAVLTLACGAGLANPAWPARWFDRLPADDPDTVPSRHTTPRNPPAAPALPAGGAWTTAGGVLGGAYGVTTFLLSSVVGAVQTASSATRQALWETSYMLGTNGTKVPRPNVVDPFADDTPTPEPAGTAPPSAEAPIVAQRQTVPAGPAREPPAADAAIDRPAQPARPGAIDPGLLANFIYDRGARRPDGTFFVPKSLQRLFEVRTRRIEAAEVPVTLKLAGRIVPDSQFHGAVEASVVGRIEPPETGLPVLGQTVRKGDILGYILPAVGVVDRTQVRREVARLTTDIRIEIENLEILKQFSFVPFRDGKIYQSEQRIAGLRRERAALLPLLQTHEALRASADGVISASTAIAGRIVHPGETVFTITSPKRLWVEASAPDPTIADNAARVRMASATTPEGQTLGLSFIGSGLALQQQSAPILFRIDDPPDGLRVGRPVTVTVQSENRSQRGLPIARSALTIGADGVQEVWEQSEPEIFLPHAVRTQDLGGGTVLIVDGLQEGARVVVNGARLLAQLQ